jgi:3-dehydroquinate synthase
VKIINIKGQSGDSQILINESLQNLSKYVAPQRPVIVTDHNVNHCYRSSFPVWDVIEIGTGEEIKTLKTVEGIYQQLVDLEIDRSCFIVGIGGGIVCDITGFVASTYMRGLPFGFVSSTLLSQVDASVGGKNGVNFHGYKNMVGVFNQPCFVICDTEMLKTLPRNELICGFAEVVKHAVIGDREFFTFLEQRYTDALNLDQSVMERLVYDSILVKSSIVERDEREKGERRKLNFGHTLAHALEKTTDIPHGEAVSIGMVFAANLSVLRHLLSKEEANRLRLLLKQLHLPIEIKTNISKEKIKDAIRKDKKREGQGIHVVLLKAIGEVIVEEIPLEELEVLIDDMHLHW